MSGSVASDNDHEIIVRIKLTASGQYKVHFKTSGGLANPNPTLNQITVLKDNPPLVQFVRPDRPALKAPANAKVPLRIKASDDFGVREATLYVAQKNGARIEVVQPPRNYLERKDPIREFAQDEVIDLAALKARPGTVFEYWAVVRDTREPHANKVETGHQTIEATEPAAKKDLQSVENPKNLDEPQKSDDAEEDDAKPNNAPQDPSDEAQKSKDASAKGRDGADDSGKANEARDNTGKGNDRDAADDNAKPQPRQRTLGRGPEAARGARESYQQAQPSQHRAEESGQRSEEQRESTARPPEFRGQATGCGQGRSQRGPSPGRRGQGRDPAEIARPQASE